MNVDIQSLGTFNELAHEGAKQATASMSQMTGIDADVDVTQITLMDRANVGEALGEQAFVGVEFDFEGELSGQTVLVLDQACSETLTGALLPGDGAGGDMAKSGVKEIGNIMMSGFIDGWADYLETTIEHSPPTYIEGTGKGILPTSDTATPDDQVFVFKSEIEWVDESVDFYIYMLPDQDSLTEVMADHVDAEEDAIPVDKLHVFNRMTREGTRQAAENVSMMTGIDVEAEVSQINFARIEDVPKQVGTDQYVGTAVEFTGLPSGFLLVLFDEASAKNAAEALMPTEVDGDGLTDQHTAAIEELGNIMTSGFVDGWANVLQTSVDHTPPRLVHDMGRAIIDPLAAQVGQQQDHAFVIDSRMQTEDVEFESEIYALPNDEELRQALEALAVERAEKTDADPEEIFQ
ncbi:MULTISPECIES: chemotaxis protein CheC [unclassified Halorhabdus]|uniref:chemotaxis protein CheC n=1 Tax=unclassified Halorhabdus TaxID=2621901 RepID=UPI0023DA928F|nr:MULTISPECIES: chemotaxis protein CheC [unclassified Halorhabdus]WEL16852.1 Chemotaxis protein CheC, inhibitor of MCP methylation [Halorhabdus sp. SVX81]WEL20726.1 Chemotaxis protein CheC, inhibitor of MCP methylation [Halorhabdus sp. BNX81]